MYSLFKNTMSQYNNGNHINNIPVIPDYLDLAEETNTVDEGSFIKITKSVHHVEDQENQNGDEVLMSTRFTLNGSMITIDETEEDGEREPARDEDEAEAEAEGDGEAEEVEEEVLNTDDEDEIESKSKIYVISVNNIPYYYEENLKDARQQMLNLANHFAASLNEKCGPGHIYVTDHNLKRVKVIAPYSFLMLTYNHLMYEISLEYAIKL
jgi:hypothetical protein